MLCLDKLSEIESHYKHLEEQMTDPEIITDISRYTKINKEYKDLEEIMKAYGSYKLLLSNITTAKEMLKDSDQEMREMAEMELETLEPEREELEEELKLFVDTERSR